MSDFSIELAAERIVDRRTREVFREVQSSYANGNYRSATVMLWSVVVVDLVFKLEELETAYSDPAAIGILKDLTEKQAKNPNSPQWESELLEAVKQRTLLLDVVEYENLVALQRQRHLAAHPILTGFRELAAPTREMVRANIRCALEAVLTKPALMSRKVYERLVEDLEKLGNQELEREEVEKFLVGKYLRHMLPKVEDSIFRSLWTFVFKKGDDRFEENRKINRVALEILFGRRPEHCGALMEADARHYGDVGSDGTCRFQLVVFLANQGKAFSFLPEQAKVLVRAEAANDPDARAVSWFLSGSLEEHLKMLISAVDREGLHFRSAALQVLRRWAETDGPSSIVLADRLAVVLYGASRNFNEADARYSALIKPVLERLSPDDIQTLVARIEANEETYARGRARADHPALLETVRKKLGSRFQAESFPKFMASASGS